MNAIVTDMRTREPAKLHRRDDLSEDRSMTKQYLSKTEIAEQKLGIKGTSLDVRSLPKPDVRIGTVNGWSEKTIDAWIASRPGSGNWGTKKTAKKR